MSDLSLKSQLSPSSDVKIIQFSDEQLSKFHGFSVVNTCLDNACGRKVSDELQSASRLGTPVWLEIFKYLTPKEIFRFIMSAKGWSSFIDVNYLRNQFPLLVENNPLCYFVKCQLKQLAPDEKIQFRLLESLNFTYSEFKEIAEHVAGKVPCHSIQFRRNADEFRAFLQRNNMSTPELVQINLRGVKLDKGLLEALSIAAPNLIEMDLGGRDNYDYGDLSVFRENSQMSLEKVSLGEQTSSEDVLRIFAAAPRLKELSLGCCRISSEVFSGLVPNSLPFLRDMTLFKNASIADILLLIRAAPNLVRIYFPDCSNLLERNPSIQYVGTSSGLNRLDFSWSKISFANLQILLSVTPKLQELRVFSKYIGENNAMILKPGSLPELKEIVLNYSSITTSNLQILLMAVSQLKVLAIWECENISEGHLSSLAPNSLPFLEMIDAEKSTIKIANLLALVRAAPHLKRIDVTRCHNLSKADLERIPKKIELITDYSAAYYAEGDF